MARGHPGSIEIPPRPPLSKGGVKAIFRKTPPFRKGRLGGIFEKNEKGEINTNKAIFVPKISSFKVIQSCEVQNP
jgi:hypothetical protein